MNRWVPLLLIATAIALSCGCATGAATERPSDALEACSLDDETACVKYAVDFTEASDTPFGQLVVGLSDRATTLSGKDAVPYHFRIVELMRSSTSFEPEVARRASASHVVVAAIRAEDLRDFDWNSEEALSLEARMEEIAEVQREIRQLSTFSVNNGTPASQAEAAWLIVYAYERHAELLRQVVIPSELTAPARAAFAERLEALAASLEAEGERFRTGLRAHCTRHQLSTNVCRLAR